MRLFNVLLLPVITVAVALLPQEAPTASPRSEPAKVAPRTGYADHLGTVRISRANCFGGSFLHSAGNPTFVLVIESVEPRPTNVSIEAFTGFTPGSTNRVIGVRTQRRPPETESRDSGAHPVESAGSVSIDDLGVIRITDLALAGKEQVELYVDLARTPASPEMVSIGFIASYH